MGQISGLVHQNGHIEATLCGGGEKTKVAVKTVAVNAVAY